jgi:hypothetical protein
MSSKKGPDPRSGIRKKFIPDPDPGGKKAPDPGSGSATLLMKKDIEYNLTENKLLPFVWFVSLMFNCVNKSISSFFLTA